MRRSVAGGIAVTAAAVAAILVLFLLVRPGHGRLVSAGPAGTPAVGGGSPSAVGGVGIVPTPLPDIKASPPVPGKGRSAPPKSHQGHSGHTPGSPPPGGPGHRHHGGGGGGGGVPSGGLFVGVAVKGDLVSGVRSFSRATRAHMSLVEIYAPFGGAFPQRLARQAVSVGAAPLVQWDPRRQPLGRIAAGAYNGYLRRYAAQVKAFGHGIVLSFGHEMNGKWSPWGPLHASPAQFVAAWRRVHDVFAAAHVRNVAWSWDPSHTGTSPQPWWPGSAYVDRIGIDGYQRPGQTFAEIFASRLAEIRSYASKPIYIAETSVATGAGQASQVVGLFNGVRQYHLQGFVWFDINQLEPWRLEGRPSAIAAFRTCLARVPRPC